MKPDREVEYIIVQAGGKGSRLEHLTENKPKALVPVDNLPMIFHLFRKFPDRKFIVIADTHREVLREYLETFAKDVSYLVVDATGTGTCAGVSQAASFVPEGEPLMIIWSDLILSDGFSIPNDGLNYVGLSQTFPCRWSFQDGRFIESPSETYGVAGLFVLSDKSVIADVPPSGELVRWFSQSGIEFRPLGIGGTREFGVLAEYKKLDTIKTRPFNKMTMESDRVIKVPLDAQGRALAKREMNWYRFAIDHGVKAIPNIYSLEPLTMERLEGSQLYDLGWLNRKDRASILHRVVQALKNLHSVASTRTNYFSVRDAYYTKTIQRLSLVRDLIPHTEKPLITINGRICRNVFFHKQELEVALSKIIVPEFTFIHGDNTFSNIILVHEDHDEPQLGSPKFIDPRGYFGFTELFGDPNYDWAKLYYSVAGNYDQFNLKRFRLKLTSEGAQIDIRSNGWEDLADELLRLADVDATTVRLLHAIIWLSLTTYAWQDYDSILGSFYMGLYYLEEVL